MERSIRVGRMSQMVIVVMLVALSLALPSVSAAAVSVPVCGVYPGSDAWSEGRYCNTVSTQYPRAVGRYGHVGSGGGACGPVMPGSSPRPGMTGICLAPAPEPVWKHVNGKWEKATLNVGTRVYVHPMNSEWRWIYSDRSWYAIPATRLYLVWRV